MNGYTKVVESTVGVVNTNGKGVPKPQDDYLRRSILRNHEAVIEASMAVSEKRYEMKQLAGLVANKQLFEQRIPFITNELVAKGKDIIFKELLFEMYMKALLLDEPEKNAFSDNIRGLMETYIDERGGYKLLESQAKATNSPILKQMVATCENIAHRVAKRKILEVRQSGEIETLNFDLDSDEKDAFDYDKDKISADDIADLVKNKVLTVVKDEQARQKKEDEVYQELERIATDTGQTVAEVAKTHVMRQTTVEEATLFNALTRASYMENVSVSGGDDDDDDEEYEKANYTSKEVTRDEFHPNTVDDINGLNEPEAELGGNGGDDDIDFDLILGETIVKYTLMELTYAIMLENFNYTDMQKLSQKIIYSLKK